MSLDALGGDDVERAAGQLLRWESHYGWTRRGDGWVSQWETALAHVVARMLPPDAPGRRVGPVHRSVSARP